MDEGQPFVAGVYPLLLDETCYFLAVDFDKAGWQADAVAFLHGCRRLGLVAALERSRSGRGGHVWLFFEEAIPASLRADSGHTSSPRRWRIALTSGWTPTTGYSRIKTPCRRAVSET